MKKRGHTQKRLSLKVSRSSSTNNKTKVSSKLFLSSIFDRKASNLNNSHCSLCCSPREAAPAAARKFLASFRECSPTIPWRLAQCWRSSWLTSPRTWCRSPARWPRLALCWSLVSPPYHICCPKSSSPHPEICKSFSANGLNTWTTIFSCVQVTHLILHWK